MNPPVVVWSRNDLRIVAVDANPDLKDDIPTLMLERRNFDLLDNESWELVHLCEDAGASDAVIDLMQAIAADIDMLPKWVRDFVRDRQGCYEDFTGTGGKGGAA